MFKKFIKDGLLLSEIKKIKNILNKLYKEKIKNQIINTLIQYTNNLPPNTKTTQKYKMLLQK
jgi:hypothetical protein